MSKIIVETTISESFSDLTKKFINSLFTGKVKKLSVQNDENGKTFSKAVKDLKTAGEEINKILDKNPELKEKFKRAFK